MEEVGGSSLSASTNQYENQKAFRASEGFFLCAVAAGNMNCRDKIFHI